MAVAATIATSVTEVACAPMSEHSSRKVSERVISQIANRGGRRRKLRYRGTAKNR